MDENRKKLVARQKITSATFLQLVSFLFHLVVPPFASRGQINISNLHQQVHRGAQSCPSAAGHSFNTACGAPSEAVLAETLLQLVSSIMSGGCPFGGRFAPR